MATFSPFSAGNKESAPGRGFSGHRQEEDYVVILPHLPSGITTLNYVFLHCDVKGRPYHVEDFREEMRTLDVLLDVEDLDSYQMSDV